MLSDKELSYLEDTDFLLTKQKVLRSLSHLMEEVKEVLMPIAQQRIIQLPRGVDVKVGKVSRGEQYQGLPYIVLDFPRFLTQSSMFAYRTIFWWGNEFSCHMLLSGDFWEKQRPNILSNLPSKEVERHYFAIASTPWEHHFQEGNYLKGDSLTTQGLASLIKGHAFFKVGQRLPLHQYERLPEFAENHFRTFTSWLK